MHIRPIVDEKTSAAKIDKRTWVWHIGYVHGIANDRQFEQHSLYVGYIDSTVQDGSRDRAVARSYHCRQPTAGVSGEPNAIDLGRIVHAIGYA